MNTAALHEERPALQAVAANTLPVLAALLLLWHAPSHAGQSTGQFPVTINLQGASAPAATPAGTSSTPATAFCRSGTMVGAFGSPVTVVCATGITGTTGMPTGVSSLPWTSMPDNTYRFMLSNYRDGEQFHETYSYGGAGTVASWRMIKLNDRDYLEMMLHW